VQVFSKAGEAKLNITTHDDSNSTQKDKCIEVSNGREDPEVLLYYILALVV
jgi:hypothetical protein